MHTMYMGAHYAFEQCLKFQPITYAQYYAHVYIRNKYC